MTSRILIFPLSSMSAAQNSVGVGSCIFKMILTVASTSRTLMSPLPSTSPLLHLDGSQASSQRRLPGYMVFPPLFIKTYSVNFILGKAMVVPARIIRCFRHYSCLDQNQSYEIYQPCTQVVCIHFSISLRLLASLWTCSGPQNHVDDTHHVQDVYLTVPVAV